MAYGDRRQPWHPSQRRTYSRPVAGYRQLGVGQVTDLVAMSISQASNILGAFGGSVDGSPSDKRVQLLLAAYQTAKQGNPAGKAYLQAWIADNPPHPAYSNTIAQQLLNALASPAGAAAAASNPTIIQAGIPITPPVSYGLTGVGGPSLFTLALLAGAGILVVRAAR